MSVLTASDVAYRRALGLPLEGPLPRALGTGGSTARAERYDAGVASPVRDGRVFHDDDADGADFAAAAGGAVATDWFPRGVVDARRDREHRADARAARRTSLTDAELAVLHGRGVLGSRFLVAGGDHRVTADYSRFGVLPF